MRELAKEILARVPGGMEVAVDLSDRWLNRQATGLSWKALPGWLDDLARTRLVPMSPDRRVLVFTAYEGWIRLGLAMTTVLLSRHSAVDFVFLPFNDAERDDPWHVAKLSRIRSRRFEDSGYPHLRVMDLRDTPAASPTERMILQSERQSRLDTNWILQREELDLVNDTPDRRVYEFRLWRNLDAMSRLASLLKTCEYDCVLTPNGNLVEFGALYRLGELVGRPVTSFDFGEWLAAIVMSSHHPAGQISTVSDWEADAPHVLTPEVRDRVGRLIETRRQTSWEGFVMPCQRAPYVGDQAGLLAKLSISRNGRPIVLLCPNIAWDNAWLSQDSAFESLVEWVRHTVRHFAADGGRVLVVRVHPAESTAGTAEPLRAIIQDCCPNLPEHICVVGPDDPVNTYDLMDICDLGLVSNSTTGLEMALRGLPVVVVGQPHFARKGFTLEAETREQYEAAIERALADPLASRLSARQLELAWCYADVYFHRWPKPFPWRPETFWKDVQEWPMSRVLSAEGQARYGRTFDLLVGRVTLAEAAGRSSAAGVSAS